MHDQTSEIRRLVSEAAPPQAVGEWKVVGVPTGVRVNTTSDLHFERATKALIRQGYALTRMRPVAGRKPNKYTLVVTGWDGERLRALVSNLRRQVVSLTDELAGCPSRTVELYERYRLFEGHDRRTAVDLTFEQLEADRLNAQASAARSAAAERAPEDTAATGT